MAIELVVFDMAGTTVDEDNVVYKTLRAAINDAGYSFSQQQVQSLGAGKEKFQAIRDLLATDDKSHSEEELRRIFEDFKAQLKNAYRDLDVCEQPGSSELFSALKSRGVKVVLNTGYDRATAENLIRKIGWNIGKEIDGLVTASDVENGRPAPDMIFKAMELVGVSSADRVAKVGDSQVDIQEGQNAECALSIGITTGAQTATQLHEAKPSVVIDCLKEILEVV